MHMTSFVRLAVIKLAMLKSYKSSLNLNSYKLDTRGYQEKIRELIEENAELKAQLQRFKAKEGQLLEQLKNTKLEVHTLRNVMRSEYVVHEDKCKNCAAHSQQSIDRLVADIDSEKARGHEFRRMYENEVENKKQLTEYYQKKLRLAQRDKDIMVKKYEEKLKYLSANHVSSIQSLDSSTSIHHHLQSPPKTQQEIMPKTPQQLTPLPQRNDKAIKRFPPPSPKINSPRVVTPQRQAPQVQPQSASSTSSESITTTLIQPIVEKLRKMQISFEELKAIPQVQRFAQSPNPPKNKFIKLLRDFPFECEDDDLIEESYKEILHYLQTNRINYNGQNIINFLTQKMEAL